MARSTSPDDNNLLPKVFLCSCVLEGVDNLALEFFLQPDSISPVWSSVHELKKKDLLRERREISRSSPKSRSKNEVGGMENAFGFSSIWEYSSHFDVPRSGGILFNGCDGRRRPDVKFHVVCIGFEPISQLFNGYEGFQSTEVASRTFGAGVHTGQFWGNLEGD